MEQTREAPCEAVAEVARAPASAGAELQGLPGPLEARQVLRLQQTAGNRATRRLIQRTRAQAGRTLARDVTLPEVTVEGVPWKADNVRAVQTELTRLRLYDKGIDGK